MSKDGIESTTDQPHSNNNEQKMSAFDEPCPNFSLKEQEDLARSHFGISGTARPLESERDQNSRLDAGSASYVLKIANTAEDLGALNLQNGAMRHLEHADVAGIPRLVPSLSGADMMPVERDGKTYQIRLITWLEGATLSKAPRSPAQMEALGAFMGRVSKGLQGFGTPTAFRPEFPWALDEVLTLEPLAESITDPARQAMVQRLFERYRENVLPVLPRLRAGVLHQDANDNNVIVDADDPDRIAGLVDFGDMCFGRTINELAITLAYALLDNDEIYQSATRLIAGYVKEFPLEEAEADALFDLMRMRLAASVCLSSHRAALYPNNPYLVISQAPAFELLEKLDALDTGLMIALFRKAAGFSATRNSAVVRDYLETRQAEPMFRPDPVRSARIALPCDGTHSGMPAFSDKAFDAWFAAQKPAGLPANQAFYGFGLYGENRKVYAADHFADPGGSERRTRHLGIDVFAPARTAVHAPLSGKVYSVANNLDPLDYGHTLILEHRTDDGTPFWTLFGHLAADLPDLVKAGQTVQAGDLIAHLGDWPENGGWAPHLHFQIMTDLLDQTEGNFYGVGHDSQWPAWSDICIDPNLVMKLAPESFEVDPNPPEELMARRSERLGPSMSVSYREKLKIVRGEGPWLIDHTGRGFLDAVNNITHVGHCHPRVVEAAARQAARLNTNTRYLNNLILDFADRITATLPDPLSVAFFVNSGSEANELAMRIARTALGTKSTLVLDWAYHGNTGGMIDISPYKFKRKGGYPKPDFVEIAEFPDPYRGPHKGYGPEQGKAYAADIEACLARLEARSGSRAATFIAESISGVGGQILYPDGYFAEVYERIRANGGICIADEVQCGFGRVGSDFWGFELQNVVPDIVVMGKPIGNGHPLAAVVTTSELAHEFANGMEYFNSFGGNPVSMATGMAVMDVIEDEGLQAQALETGRHLLAGFRALKERFDLIGDVRGTGLFLGVELVKDRQTLEPATEEAGWIINHMRQNGVLASTDGPLDNVLKFKPPMVFGKREADVLLETLTAAFEALEAQGAAV